LENNAQYKKMLVEEEIELRKLIISSLIKFTKYFTLGPYEELLKNQDKTKNLLYSENIDTKIMKLLKMDINSIGCDVIKPSLVIFINAGNSVSIQTTCSENKEEFKNLEKLYNSQNLEYQKLRMYGLNKGNNTENIPKLKSINQINEKKILNMILNFIDAQITDLKLNEIVGNYAYKADNFIKVILIEMTFKLINKKNILLKN
jgi:hypothetical protein